MVHLCAGVYVHVCVRSSVTCWKVLRRKMETQKGWSLQLHTDAQGLGTWGKFSGKRVFAGPEEMAELAMRLSEQEGPKLCKCPGVRSHLLQPKELWKNPRGG